ncbi:MAG: HAMP domain-containing sensor histidine kinase [Candidatus Eisenbacteria bacterium]
MIGPTTTSSRGKTLLKTALFVGGSLLVVAVFLFTQSAVGRLTREVSTTSELLARVIAQATLPSTRNKELQDVLVQMQTGISFPIVITDTTGVPRAWSHVKVPNKDVSPESIDSVTAGIPIAPVIAARLKRVRDEVPQLDRMHTPIPLRQGPNAPVLGHLHYGNPPVLQQLRWTPIVAVAGTGLLLLLGLSGFTGIRQAEKRVIWVGMAKETAHQLGTPLSSLMGWVELLRVHAEPVPDGGEVRISKRELTETLTDMEGDVDRLSKVAQRFSHIGSAPQLVLQDVGPVVREAVQYMRRRVPQGQGAVEIRERYEEVPPINLNRELLEWVLENLLSNALSALDKPQGLIEIVVERRGQTEEVEISVSDNGRGMSKEQQKRAFDAGYSTKRRGWGLGLALARRVVEEYHAGRIGIRHSAPGEGTTMVIRFPT